MSDIGLQKAIRDIIAGLSPPIIPTTTLTAAAVAGTQTPLQVASNTRFLEGSRLAFLDTLGEEMLGISAKSAPLASPVTITLNFTNTGYVTPGGQYTHPIGTVVYSNLQANAPVDMTAGLQMGDPYIFVYGWNERVRRRGLSNKTGSVYIFRIEYHRQLTVPGSLAGIDVNLWADRQQTAARTDLETIKQALIASKTLRVGGQDQALVIGDLGTQGAFANLNWVQMPVDAASDEFAAALDLTVTAKFNPYS